jgi:AcrR family transcriptional regulator
MARRTKEEAEATRESVLLAALDLFSEQSCSHATFSDIARRIGMTRGAVYRHFENKPALLAALIEYICDRQRHLTGEPIPAICSIGDVRRAFIAHAGVVASDAMVRRFEFFMHYQMEWSAELLIETHKTLNEFRKNPLDESRVCFQLPAIARCLRDGVNVDPLILTLPAFRAGLCKM